MNIKIGEIDLKRLEFKDVEIEVPILGIEISAWYAWQLLHGLLGK
jgi:hypothetical protein